MRAVAALVAVAAAADALRLGHVDVVLVGPQYASNVGQVCRLAACFGVGHLRVVAPEYDRAAEATYERRFAMPQGRVVLNERSTEHADLGDALRHVDTSVAFSRRSGALRRHAALPDALPALAAGNRRVALVFGREADGLTTEELAACGGSVEIASDDSLNLSHAVAIALANLYAAAGGGAARGRPPRRRARGAPRGRARRRRRLPGDVAGPRARGPARRGRAARAPELARVQGRRRRAQRPLEGPRKQNLA